MDTTILTAIAAVVLIPVAGLFAALDAALSTVSVARVEEMDKENRHGATRLSKMLATRPRYINVTVLLHMLSLVAAAVLFTVVFNDLIDSTGWALAVAVVVQLVVLYLPGEQVPEAGFAVPGLDKAIHVAVFALPAFLAVGRGRSAWWALPFAVHAPVSELVQHAWVPLRTGDPVDVVADLAGVVLGVLAAWSRRIGGSGASGV